MCLLSDSESQRQMGERWLSGRKMIERGLMGVEFQFPRDKSPRACLYNSVDVLHMTKLKKG